MCLYFINTSKLNAKYYYDIKQNTSANSCPSLPQNFYIKHHVFLDENLLYSTGNSTQCSVVT